MLEIIIFLRTCECWVGKLLCEKLQLFFFIKLNMYSILRNRSTEEDTWKGKMGHKIL